MLENKISNHLISISAIAIPDSQILKASCSKVLELFGFTQYKLK